MAKKNVQTLKSVTIRFAGDSGDGMQLTGSQFTNDTAILGYDLTTLPDYPAEIRAPAGTLFGVSGFQIQFSGQPVHTPGDSPDVLIAMNPAALKVNLKILKDNGIIIVNRDAFQARNLELAGYKSNPLEDESLTGFQVFPVDITTLTKEALKDSSLSVKEKDRAKNFFALGILYWLFTRSMDSTMEWIKQKFKNDPEYMDANIKALNAGYSYALSTELFATSFHVEKAQKKPGKYRNVTGNEALTLGLITAAKKADKELFLGSYPITPASEILHELSKYKNYNVKTFQAEDEIAGIGAAVGASYAGAFGATTTSGPGMALKTEFMGLAIILEIPLIIINVQRGGPSTGLPTKTEQADLLQAVYGRNGEAPMPVIAASSPADCFQTVFEAAQVAFKYTTPIIVLSDGYLANGSEPWWIPPIDSLPEIKVEYAKDPDSFKPYKRNPETLARMLALPGTPGLEHHVGGLEKNESGNVSYDSENHDLMIRLRAEKIKRINDFVKMPELVGPEKGDLLVVSWGSTYGVVRTAIEQLLDENKSVAGYHLRWINPLPKKLGEIIHNYKNVLVPEINLGQLIKILRSEYLVDAKGFNKVRGLPLNIKELRQAILDILKG
ncbi:MAG: 2-oxoacid:acceptor oxidoreductase subunit alpha [Calditrichaceae bacterium]|nr:2-oxoacid:acceptor oxidoreductase subunit alpha [Calditrichaceae bacterium]MBN2708761.1 2-oxoacid:acceptor oxidoreductase subunit alpha [Calditrichaceae bacterium]RQV97128.1 MAG: 2-oxoacid:acceptor oxidoreductase subunit alpha [Calditrichota bacterium]